MTDFVQVSKTTDINPGESRVVEANDKRFARIKVLETCCAALEAALERADAKRR